MTRRRRRSDRSGRAPLFSPGRPVVAGRDEQRQFWAAIAAGMASEDAAVQAGMSQAVGTRLFRKAGGMPPAMFRPSADPLSGRYLSFAEREEIALLRVQGCSVREVARRLGRAASTISRELRRNAATRSGGLEYRATTALAAKGIHVARQPSPSTADARSRKVQRVSARRSKITTIRRGSVVKALDLRPRQLLPLCLKKVAGRAKMKNFWLTLY